MIRISRGIIEEWVDNGNSSHWYALSPIHDFTTCMKTLESLLVFYFFHLLCLLEHVSCLRLADSSAELRFGGDPGQINIISTTLNM